MKKRIEQVSEPWLTDQKDPDNWLVIPEFGVSPADVLFEGFAFPIVDPSSKHLRDRHENIRTLVKFIRSKIQENFSSLADVRAAHLRVLDVVLPSDGSDPKDEDIDALSREDKQASFYIFAMKALDRATSDRVSAGLPKTSEIAADELSNAAVWIVHWLGDDLGQISRALRNAAEARASPRHKENRQIKAEAIEWYKVHRDQYSNKDLAAQAMTSHFPMEYSTIRGWLKGM